MKTCTICKLEKNSNKFDLQRNQCKRCRATYANKKAKTRFYEITVEEKKCSICMVIKPANNFDRNMRNLSGLVYDCKECRSKKTKQMYLANPEKYKEKSTKIYNQTKNTEAFKNKKREYQKRKMSDPHYVLTRRLRNRLYYALQKKSWKKNTKFSEYIGCSLEELKIHLEKQFITGMSWENQGEWHIDHIIPLDSATSEEELYKLCHFTNLQPMWAADNIKKGTKI